MGVRTFTFLGAGTSAGIPMVGRDCAVCRSTDPHNRRHRPPVLIRAPHGNIPIDAAPELRLRSIRADVSIIHAALYTHYHADHLFGLGDLRPVSRDLGRAIPLFCTGEVGGRVRAAYAHASGPEAEKLSAGFIPKLRFEWIENEPSRVIGETITPTPLIHAHW